MYLNLSNGLLRDEDLISLFNETWDFRNLKTLILESNKLTENFLYAIISKDYSLDKKFFYLKVLNLSDNKISCPDVDKFSQFLETLKSLQTFELKYTPFEQCINQFYKKRVLFILIIYFNIFRILYFYKKLKISFQLIQYY